MVSIASKASSFNSLMKFWFLHVFVECICYCMYLLLLLFVVIFACLRLIVMSRLLFWIANYHFFLLEV